jgi:hypothetical protein
MHNMPENNTISVLVVAKQHSVVILPYSTRPVYLHLTIPNSFSLSPTTFELADESTQSLVLRLNGHPSARKVPEPILARRDRRDTVGAVGVA